MPAVRNRTDILVRLVARCDTAAAMRPRHHLPIRLLRLLLVAGLLAAGLVPGRAWPASAAPKAAPGPEGVRASYAVLVDPATGAVLWGRRSRTSVAPASLTKMLTALTVRASLELDGVTV